MAAEHDAGCEIMEKLSDRCTCGAPETPVYDTLREQITKAMPLIVGHMVVDLRPSRRDALAAELVELGIAFAVYSDRRQVEIDGATVLF